MSECEFFFHCASVGGDVNLWVITSQNIHKCMWGVSFHSSLKASSFYNKEVDHSYQGWVLQNMSCANLYLLMLFGADC